MERSSRNLKHSSLELIFRHRNVVPGLVLTALVILLRTLGALQSLEWGLFDRMLQVRLPEAIDESILIVGINEADVRKVGKYPIPDQDLANLIERLQAAQPTVIGLDIFRDLPVQPGHTALVNLFRSGENLIGIEKALPDVVKPAAALPGDRVGFADSILDDDGKLRRSLLATPVGQEFKFSLSILLAQRYLKSQGVEWSNGSRDPSAFQFGQIELDRLHPNSGSYINAEIADSNQILLNFRAGSQPFRIVSMGDVMAGRVPADWIRDRIVLIGVTTPSAKDLVNTDAVRSQINSYTSGQIYGVEIQAHAVSQIVRAVLDQRPLLRPWTDGWEYAWILFWGVGGVVLGKRFRSPLPAILGVSAAHLALIMSAYGLLLMGSWIPLVPAFLALVLSSAVTAALHQYEQSWRARIQDRQLVIDSTFDAIHNGPLQTLARLLSQARSQELPIEQVYQGLEKLNTELRAVYEVIHQETLNPGVKLALGNGLAIDLQNPVHEVLYEVYSNTLLRDFPYFKTLKFQITNFEELDNSHLSLEHKQGLCRFLEEALCNVGKHAVGATRLEVYCKQQEKLNQIQVIDNGCGTDPVNRPARPTGRGTQQAKSLAHRLGGTFQRSPNAPYGTICEFSWPTAQPHFWKAFSIRKLQIWR